MANGLKALGSYLADDTLSDEALDFVADPYADRVTRIQRSGQSSPELQAFLARTDATQEQRDAERAVEAASRLPQVKAREDIPQEGVPPLLRRTEGMEPRVSSVSAPSNLGLNSFLRQLAASRPSSEGVSADLLGPFFKPVNESSLPLKDTRLAVEPSPTMAVIAPRTGPPTPKPASVASPIPVASAPVKTDVSGVAAGTIAPTTPTQPAPPAGTSSTMKPPPVEAGSGGDDEMGRLSMGQALVRALEGSGSVISGQNLRSGAADTLGDRMKQIEALRAKKLQTAEDRALEASTWGASNRATLASALAQWKGDPEKTAGLEALTSGADTTKPGDFSRNVVNAVMTKPKVLGAEAGVGKTVAATNVANANAVAVPKKLEQGDKKIAETAAENLRRDAREWARIRAAANVAASKASAGQPEVVQKEVRATTQKLGDSVAKEYGEISSALKEADRSLVAIKNQPPDVFAKVMQATNLDGLNTLEERALFRSVGELRRAAQKAQSGLAVTENERAEFLQLFGANWLQSPLSLIEAIEWMRRKTKDKLDLSFATYRAQGSVGNTAVQAYREAGGVTPDAQFLLPFNERQLKFAGPKASPAGAPAGMVRVKHSNGRTTTVDRATADQMLKDDPTNFSEVK